MGATLSLIFTRLATKFSNLVQKKKPLGEGRHGEHDTGCNFLLTHYKMNVNIQTIPELKQFVVPDVRPTGRELGRGAYGTVEEVEIPGATCTAKIIHETLLRMGNEDEVRSIT